MKVRLFMVIRLNMIPIFVTYHKKEDIAKSTMYEDAFVNNQIFSWMTRSRVSLDSVESQNLIGCLRMCC